MTFDGFIEIEEQRDPVRGRIVHRDYRWRGGPLAEFHEESSTLREIGDVFRIGPFQAKVVDYTFFSDSYKVIRVEGWSWRFRYLWHRLTPLLSLAYHRFIVTLAIWNLATFEQHRIPSWRDIKVPWRGN